MTSAKRNYVPHASIAQYVLANLQSGVLAKDPFIHSEAVMNNQLKLCCLLDGRQMMYGECTCGYKICDGCIAELQKNSNWNEGKRFVHLTVVADLHDEFANGKCPRFIGIERKVYGA